MPNPMLFDAAPEIRPTPISIRDYQLDAVTAIRKRFEAGDRSTLLVLPTGTGKTITFGYLVRRMVVDEGARALVLAHRGELIQQAADKLYELGLTVGVEQAASRARSMGEPHAVVATVQTLQERRLQSWPRDYFDLIVTDEAHHAVADSYRKVYDHFGNARHLGVTATADRGDRINLGEVFESVAYEMSLLDAMTASAPGPYLSRLTVVQCDLPIDLSAIRTTAGDLNAADLEEAIKPHVEMIANAIKQEVGDRPTLVFCPDVGSASAIASACSSIFLKAAHVSGNDPDRSKKISDYKEGKIQVLCNCNLLTEGFDAPHTAAVVLCRPTKSRALYAQMVGRGTRLAAGKTDCLLVDFDWICGRHKLVQPVELLGTKLAGDEDEDAAIAKRAQSLLKNGQESDLLDAIERARSEKQEADQRAIRLKVADRSLSYRRVAYDPLATFHAIGMPTHFPRESRPAPASESQINTLRKLGCAVGDDISKRRASMMLDVLVSRIKAGLASQKQVGWLIANGVEPAAAAAMTFADASAELDRLFGGNRRRTG